MGGTGPRTPWPSWARRCTWRTRWGSRGSPIVGSRTMSVTLRIWPICCGWVGFRKPGSLHRQCRELRELVRHRAKLVGLRTNLKCQIHAVLAGAGVPVAGSDIFAPSGREWLERVNLPAAMRAKVNSALRLIEACEFEIDTFAGLVTARLRADPGYRAIQQIPGVGPILGAVFVAEIGDIGRFSRAAQLSSWAGLTPKHDESDTRDHRGRITKMGSKLVRWAAIEAVQRVGRTLAWRLPRRRGRTSRPNQAKVAAARELVECVFYGLRDRPHPSAARHDRRPPSPGPGAGREHSDPLLWRGRPH